MGLTQIRFDPVRYLRLTESNPTALREYLWVVDDFSPSQALAVPPERSLKRYPPSRWLTEHMRIEFAFH
jgi:hypothetical protein